MISRLARRYARALLLLAREGDALETYGADIATIDVAFQEPRLRAVLLSPLVDAAKRVEIVKKVVGVLDVSGHVATLAFLLAERDRLSVLPDIARSYAAMVDEALGRSRARIRSAAPLDGAAQQEIAALAKQLAGAREVVVSTEVDAELLGGVVLDVGGTVYDGSVRTQLERLGKDMGEGGV